MPGLPPGGATDQWAARCLSRDAASGRGPDPLQEPSQYALGRKVLFGDRAGGARVTTVVAPQRLDARQHVVGRLEGEDAGARGQEVAETGVLRDHRPPRGQIADAPV